MAGELSEADITAALELCATEPVHIPGRIQSFGWLLACDPHSGLIQYASENTPSLFGKQMSELFECHLRDLFGAENWHKCKNAISTDQATQKRSLLGQWSTLGNAETFELSCWKSGEFLVLELENAKSEPIISTERLQDQNALTQQVLQSSRIEDLMDTCVRQLRHLTGFDRVMVYRFDEDWNGVVISEARSFSMEPFLGLHFPSHDIPEQARAIMTLLPLRIIADTQDENIPIQKADQSLPPLDISMSLSRSTSPIHLQYLKNMGANATMTLSIVLEGTLWGMISFHHRKPFLIDLQMQKILLVFQDVFCLKLNLLRGKTVLSFFDQLEPMQQRLQTIIDREQSPDALLSQIGDQLCDVIQGSGIVILANNQVFAHGLIPEQPAIDALALKAEQSSDFLYFTNALRKELPVFADSFGSIAGAAALRHSNGWTLIAFRSELSEEITWAGDPEKSVDLVEGQARLQPRGSFSTFLATTHQQSKTWSTEDRMFIKKLWPLLSSALNADRTRRMATDLNRQQELMIDELNHRVRNILGLVQAVSTETKRSETSLESYSQAIEARIRALAAAHTIGSGTSNKSVSIRDIITQEARPYQSNEINRIELSGDNFNVGSEYAPILALTIHELMTNAAKHGALSTNQGRVRITLQRVDAGCEMSWLETGGPPVEEARRTGFGTTLITRSIPFELGGTSSLKFLPEGVWAEMFLPQSVIMEAPPMDTSFDPAPQIDQTSEAEFIVPKALKTGLILLVEDNFMIAEGMTYELNGLGFERVEAVGTVEGALEVLASEMPMLAVLDVNLGKGQTSQPIAEVLLEQGVPFIFATGYGELTNFPQKLSRNIVLTKPIPTLELAHAIARSINDQT